MVALQRISTVRSLAPVHGFTLHSSAFTSPLKAGMHAVDSGHWTVGGGPTVYSIPGLHLHGTGMSRK